MRERGVIRNKMTNFEELIWFFMPIILAGFIGIILRKMKWFSFAKFLSIGVALGIISLVVSPTVMCTSLCDAAKGAMILSFIVDSIILVIVLMTFWLISKKREASV